MQARLELDKKVTALVENLEAVECPVCMGLHTEESHAAGLKARTWLRDEIQRHAHHDLDTSPTLSLN